jgi:hypothetical protein
MRPATHLRETEIHDFNLVGFRDHDVAGFDATVGDAFDVRGFQPFGDWDGNVDDFFNWRRLLLK